MTTLIQGGLSSFGIYVTDRLLKAGEEVIVLSEAMNEEEEKLELTNELFVGRNAQFRFLENEEALRYEGEAINHFIAMNKMSMNQTSMDMDRINRNLEEDFDYILRHCPNLKKVILISSLEVYGEATGTINENTRASIQENNDMAYFFQSCEKLYKRKCEDFQVPMLIVLRCPFVFEPESYQKHREEASSLEILHIRDAIEGIYLAWKWEEETSVSVFQLTSGQKKPLKKSNFNGNLDTFVQYSYDHASHILGFSPDYTIREFINQMH